MAFLMGWCRMQAGWALLALRLPQESPALTKVYSWEVGDPPSQDKEIGGRAGALFPSLCLPGASSAGRSQDMWREVCDLCGVQKGTGQAPTPTPGIPKSIRSCAYTSSRMALGPGADLELK